MPLIRRRPLGSGFLALLLSTGVSAAVVVQQPQTEFVDVLINFAGRPGPDDRAVVERAGGRVQFTYSVVSAIAARVPRAAIAGLSNNPRVTFIEGDFQVFADDAELDDL